MKITKKQLKKIKAGDSGELMRCIEFLIDSYEEDKFDNGYKSCIADMSVRSYRLAEAIIEIHSNSTKAKPFNVDTLTPYIEDYFKVILEQ